ncbi:MAG: hypothetical protein ACD_80C00146G0012 [uncultured bacterium (gcode 4)]|uniref:Uncharacterized protein n=1 Tax=uncultured bacterium (gcode 4) TaxID=1234023 RepID=K1XI86_9BACT|nr:MAG: hypothetical protein ACD_80C00146G0012 [uncultured bacterium (gcode 4)]
MHIKEKKFLYLNEEHVFNFVEEAQNGIKIKMFVGFQSDKFLDFQKDLLQEFVAELKDKISDEEYDVDTIKNNFEIALQNLNVRLKAFADKVRDVDFFGIKWYIQLVLDNIVMLSMIGDVSVMIFRNEKLYYSLSNSLNDKGKIDLFSDFIEGDLETHDQILYVGTKISDVFDTSDFKEMESILKSEDTHLINFFQELLNARLDKKSFGFIFHYLITGAPVKAHEEYISKMSENSFFLKIKNTLFKNKYQATVAILGIFILFMVINLLSQVLKSNTDTFVTSDGVTIDLTIEDIKKDLFMFQGMDPTSEEKSLKYNEILSKLDVLESKGRWLEDVAQFRKLLQSEYYKWFNIVYVSNLSKFDDATLGKKTKILSFNPAEVSQLGDIQSLYVWRNMIIAGSKSALVGSLDDNMRGSLVDYNLPPADMMKGCGLNLLKDGLYCFTTNSNIYSINKEWAQPVTTTDTEPFTKNIAGVVTYGKANLYVFENNVSAAGNTTLVTRYRNTLGSQTIYQGGQKYYLGANMTGFNFGSGLSNFAVDWSFLARKEGKLYQFRRNPPTAFTLDAREIRLLWGDKKILQYSNDVKIISSINSKYIYLFDRINQTFTVYDSRPAKNADQYNYTYGLYYVFMFKFDLGGTNRVVDIDIPDPSGNRPEMYILTNEWVNKVSLYDFIDSIQNNKVLKQLN